MSKQTEKVIFIGAALIGAYAAWLTIKEKQQQDKAFSDWFSAPAFSTGSLDFYKG